MSSTEKKKQEPVFTIKGFPIDAFLIETGDFRWTLNGAACDSKENTKEVLGTLSKMPIDKRTVWTMRFDVDKAIAVCPIIREDQELSRAFNEFFGVQKVPKHRNAKKGEGGEANEQTDEK